MATAMVKNWGDFQHYKNRCPPWIKLQKSLLDDFEFACLPLASKALAPLLWLLASESMDGSVRIDREWLAFRLRFTVEDVDAGLTPLISKGFLIVASDVLASCLQDACLEGEGEGEGEETPARKRTDSPSVELKTFLAECEELGEAAIPADDPIYAYAEGIALPDEYLALAWTWFKSEMVRRGKRQKDWRAHYRNAVRNNWPKYWYADDAGGWGLTTAGKQAQRAAQA